MAQGLSSLDADMSSQVGQTVDDSYTRGRQKKIKKGQGLKSQQVSGVGTILGSNPLKTVGDGRQN